jgi:hypothetical protein
VRIQRYKYLNINERLNPRTQWPTIFQNIVHYEMKFWFLRSFGVGMIHLMSIPNLSILLDGTKQFTDKNNPKRYEDSGIILATVFERDGERKDEAIRRMNAIHAYYQISNDEYLYQLYSFVLEHIRIMNIYGYRRLCRNEELAIMYFYIDLGAKMGVQDIAQTLDDMQSFNIEFETARLKYSPTNQKITSSLLRFLVSNVPGAMRSFMSQLIVSLFPAHVYWATRPIPPVSGFMKAFIHLCLRGHALFVRYLCLPRSSPNYLTQDKPLNASENIWTKTYEYMNPYPSGYTMKNVGVHPGQLGELYKCPFAH